MSGLRAEAGSEPSEAMPLPVSCWWLTMGMVAFRIYFALLPGGSREARRKPGDFLGHLLEIYS